LVCSDCSFGSAGVENIEVCIVSLEGIGIGVVMELKEMMGLMELVELVRIEKELCLCIDSL
jgi:hypothetical protein